MNKIVAISALAVCGLASSVFAGGLPEEMPVAPGAASGAGVYLGVSGGWGLTNYEDMGKYSTGTNTDGRTFSKAKKDDHFAGRVFLGYDVCRFFALETGYSMFFTKPELKMGYHHAGDPAINKHGVFKGKMVQAFDFVAKIKAPLMDNFDLFAKIGGSYLFGSRFPVNSVKYDATAESFSLTGAKKNGSSFSVAFGAGVDYAVTPNLIVNAEWLRFGGNNKASKFQPHADAFMLGLRYKFEL